MTFEVNCTAPKFEIIDLRISRLHQNLAKYFLWEKLQINKYKLKHLEFYS